MHPSNTQQFTNLHTQQQPLILINIWDPASAAIVQQSGAAALATSSASLAWANGYADGSALPTDTLLHAVRQIVRVCRVPLSVDIEDGYSESPAEVASLVSNLVDSGVAGINIEDGAGAPSLLVRKISAIKEQVGTKALFINARTDVYLRQLVEPEHRLTETVTRLQRYVTAGADGVFVPGMTNPNDVSGVASSVNAPLNLMILGNSTQISTLAQAGAARLSVGPSSFIEAYKRLIETTMHLTRNVMRNTNSDLDYDSLNSLFDSVRRT